MTESKINDLLSQMNIEEKIGQLNQYFSRGNFDPEMIRQGKAGSVINAAGALTGTGESKSSTAEVCNDIQKLALEARHKIPQLFGRDVIHGYRTIFPIPLAQAASFNPELAEQAASVAALEASATGIKWTFAPMIDIARDARWGRIAEGAGEDPFLGSQMAAAVVKGFQGDDYSAPDKLVACAKHYIGYGAAEGGRDYDAGEISEPTLRDVYMPPYEAAVKSGVATLMSAFLDLNGVPASGNRRLLTDVLRGEWGFDGFVVSDWDSVGELIHHGVAEDRADAAAIALHAGVDMDMISNAYLDTLAASLQSGKVSQDDIDEAVRRILRIKIQAGLFDQPFTDPDRATRDLLREQQVRSGDRCGNRGQHARRCIELLERIRADRAAGRYCRANRAVHHGRVDHCITSLSDIVRPHGNHRCGLDSRHADHGKHQRHQAGLRIHVVLPFYLSKRVLHACRRALPAKIKPEEILLNNP